MKVLEGSLKGSWKRVRRSEMVPELFAVPVAPVAPLRVAVLVLFVAIALRGEKGWESQTEEIDAVQRPFDALSQENAINC